MVVGLTQALTQNGFFNHRNVSYWSFIPAIFQSLQYILDLILQDTFLLLLNLAVFQ